MQVGHVWQRLAPEQFSIWVQEAGLGRVHVHPVPVDKRAKDPALVVANGRGPN